MDTYAWARRQAFGCPDCYVGEPHACPDLHREYVGLIVAREQINARLDRIETPR